MRASPGQGWPTGFALHGKPGQGFSERLEEVLGRKVLPSETLADLAKEIRQRAPSEIALTSLQLLGGACLCGKCLPEA